MKKLMIFLFIAVFITGMIPAQERNERQRINPSTRIAPPARVNPPATRIIEGTLKLERGSVAVQSGETTYLVPMLTRYIGFINELREDVKVSIEGFLLRNFIQPVKVTIGDKSYDFNSHLMFGMQFFNFGNMRQNFNMRTPAPAPKQRPNMNRQRPGVERENQRQNRRNYRSDQG